MIIEVVEAFHGEPHPNPEVVSVVLDLADRPGQTLYLFPPETVGWRALEYDYDPVADRALLLDMILHEPWEAPDPEPGTATGRVLAAARVQARPDRLPIPSRAEKAEKYQAARTLHELRLRGGAAVTRDAAVAEVVAALDVVVPAADGDLLDKLARASGVSAWMVKRGITLPSMSPPRR